jgi:hypothetical protein
MRERRQREWCDREGRSSVFRRKMRPRSGMPAPHSTVARSKHPHRCPIPASQGPSGHALGSHSVALLGIVVLATTFVARLMIIPILPATRSARICSALPWSPQAVVTLPQERPDPVPGHRLLAVFRHKGRRMLHSGNHLPPAFWLGYPASSVKHRACSQLPQANLPRRAKKPIRPRPTISIA